MWPHEGRACADLSVEGFRVDWETKLINSSYNVEHDSFFHLVPVNWASYRMHPTGMQNVTFSCSCGRSYVKQTKKH